MPRCWLLGRLRKEDFMVSVTVTTLCASGMGSGGRRDGRARQLFCVLRHSLRGLLWGAFTIRWAVIR